MAAGPVLSVTERTRQHRSARIHAVRQPARPKPKPKLGAPLSPREAQVVSLLGGRTSDDIARELRISARSVKFYVGRALAKSGTRDRAALALWFAAGAEVPAPDLRDREARIRRMLDPLANCLAEIARACEELRSALGRSE